MSADNGLRAELTRHLRMPDWLTTPIETGGTVGGVPDLHWAHVPTRTDGWVECKATSGWAVGVRPHQVSWMLTRSRAGVCCHFAIRASGVGSAGGVGDSLWLVRGSAAKELQEEGLQLPTWAVLGCWRGAPRSWDWSAIARILTTRLSD